MMYQIDKASQKSFTEDFYADEITLTTLAGLGDIFWVYQKFSPYFSKINLNIAYYHNYPPNDIEMRSLTWLECFPKVKQIQMKYFLDENLGMHPQDVARIQCPHMVDVIETWKKGGEIQYSCNRWLENGIRLEDIDTGSKVAWDIPLISESWQLPYDEYSILYTSGLGWQPHWGIDEWVELVERMYSKYSKKWPVIVLGANFDSHVVRPLCDAIASKGIPSFGLIGQHPRYVIHVIKNAKLLMGYQSGLHVVADNFDVPNLFMMFSNLYEKMQYTWCKKKNIKTLHHDGDFNSTPQQIVEDINIKL